MSPIKTSKVVLDRTLEDLYSLDDHDVSKIALVYAVPTAEVQIKASMPLSTKFSYQAPLSGSEESAILARLHLQIVPQLYGFIAGSMPLYMFDMDPEHGQEGSEDIANARNDTIRVFEALNEDKRPKVAFVSAPENVKLENGESAAIISPMDCLTHLPLLIDPERHYTLQSKRTLALSNVSTPPATVLDSRTQQGLITGNEEQLNAEVDRMIQVIRTREPPFVVKMQQSLASQGTFVVATASDKSSTLTLISTELRRVLGQQNPSNHHLHSSSLVVQDMVPGSAVALFLFVTASGETIFLGCCEQLLDANRQWIGGCIAYAQHDELARTYADIAKQVGDFAFQNGYFGPLGVDVMTAPDGRHLAIDPNPRVTGSAPLCLLRTHFFEDRRLRYAALFFPVFLGCGRDEFEERFSGEVKSGCLVIVGWSRDEMRGFSAAAFVLAAESREELQVFRKEVGKFEEEE